MKHSALFRFAAGAVAAAGVFTVLPAVAGGPFAPMCDASAMTIANPGYLACALKSGAVVTVDPAEDIIELRNTFSAFSSFASGDLMFAGRSSDAGGGPFAADPGRVSMGRLLIDIPVMGFFALALQSTEAQSYSYYLFDSAAFHGAPIDLRFDTDGIANARGTTLPSATLRFAGLFILPAAPGGTVPEPAGAALALAALGALALTTRRR